MFYLDGNELIFGDGLERLKGLVFKVLKLVPTQDINHFKIQNIFYNSKFKQKKIPFYYVEEIINFLKSLENTNIESVKQELKQITDIENQIKEEAKKNSIPSFLINFEDKKEGKVKITLPEPLNDQIKIEVFNKIIEIKNLKRNASGKYEVYKHFVKDESDNSSYFIDEDIATEISDLISLRTNLKKIIKGNPNISRQKSPIVDQPKMPEKKVAPKGPERELRLEFYDPSNGTDNRVVIKLIEPLRNQDRQFVLELVKYNFPGYMWEPTKRMYSIRGDFKQYSKMGTLLKKFGYKKEIEDSNQKGLKWILRNKIEKGGIEKTEYDGQLPEGFKEKVTFPKSDIEFFEEQKNGIAFLYGRRSAVLGDETGYGKTLQMIAAAEMRMKEIGPEAKTLVITLKDIIPQWVDEIESLLGEEERSKVSTMPLKPNKWTVMHYHQFSSGSLVQMVLNKIGSTKFSIVIFDELHKLKHEDTIRSQNIIEVTKNIPFKWGGSATISSNKPLDVRYQLQMIGHPLGKMDIDRFKQDFTGMVRSGRGWKKGSLEEEIRSAERLNKWLNLTGVYIRRSKDELRKMPNIDIDVFKAGISEEEFIKKLRLKLNTFKNPTLKISELIASRQILANLKVPATVKKAIKVVKDNLNNSNPAASKVLIFTNFIDSGRALEVDIANELRKIDPNFKVITYLGGDGHKQRKIAKEEFTNDPNVKVLVMSMKMGGTGMSFPNAAQTMIVNDFDWTPESAEQSEGRIYRINTNHDVKVLYTLVDGLDTDLYESVMRKRKIAEIIQRYRKEFLQSELDEETLKKIVSQQKRAEQIDKEIKDMIAKVNIRALEENTFYNWLNLKESLDAI